MKKFSYLILFLISTYISVAQTKPSLDSLYNIYKIARQDTTKILILGDITTVLLNNNIDSAMAVAQKMSMWSNKINYSKGKGLACQKLSIVYFTKGQYAQAKETALKGIEVLKYLREPRILAMLYNSLGMIYRIEGNYAHSIIYCEKSLLLSKLIKDKNEEASSYNNIGLVYYQQSNYVEALHYFHKSLELAEINKNVVLLARLNGNIGIIYSIQKKYLLAQQHLQESTKGFEQLGNKNGRASCLNNLGIVHQEQAQYEQALKYYEQCEQLHQELKDTLGFAGVTSNIGEVYFFKGDYPKALANYNKGLKLYEITNNTYEIAVSLYDIARVYKMQKDHQKSITYAQKGLQYAHQLNAQLQISQISQLLYENYKQIGAYTDALTHLEIFKQTNDSIFSIENTKVINQLENKITLEKKEREIAMLSKNNELHKLQIAQKQKTLALMQRQAEIEKITTIAEQEKSQRKTDSLQLTADNLLIKDQKLEAENIAQDLTLLKVNEAKDFQQKINYLTFILLLGIIIFSVYIYWSLRKEQQAKDIILNQKDEIEAINNSLEEIIKQRTIKLEERNQQLEQYAFYNAHKLRRPVATILGLYTIFIQETDEKEKAIIFQHLNTTVKELDEIVHEIQQIVKEEK